jgi:hypothetical protein
MLRSVLLAAALLATGTLPGITLDSTAQALDNAAWRLPVAPPRCTNAQADSGDVGDCLVAFYQDPATTGWGAPPAPGVGVGWNWNGYTYRGSPALADWERDQIASNNDDVAGLDPGELHTHVAAQALFEGFLTEISANGYRVRDASGYSFRCTSGNGGWSCPSGDPNDLSNHAWGLAVDMNSGSNPIRRYSQVDGKTACATPIETDLPRWVIRTAERWGLYWGGYGWTSGCGDPTTQRTSVYRDPPHFEFRGTPAQAAAIADFNLRNDPSRVCFEIIDDAGEPTETCNRSGMPEAGWRLPVQLAPPSGTVAAIVNLTVAQPTEAGYLTLEDCGPRSGTRETSAITYAAGQTIATMAVVPLAEDGRFCVYRFTDVHSIVDVVAYLGSDGEPLWFQPSLPERLTDTRQVGSCTPLLECREGPSEDRQRHLVPTSDTAARIVNTTIVGSGSPGWAQAGQCDTVGEEHVFSNVNYPDRTARSNLVVVDGGDSGACVFTFSQAHVIVDELGRLTAETGYGWQLRAPERKLDTRVCSSQWCAEQPAAHSLIHLDLGIDSPAAAVAITVTQPSDVGYVTVGRCDVLEATARPTTSNLNHRAGETTTNLAIVELDAGEMCLYTNAAAHVVVDLQAELVTDQQVGLVPISPTRAHDSRSPAG